MAYLKSKDYEGIGGFVDLALMGSDGQCEIGLVEDCGARGLDGLVGWLLREYCGVREDWPGWL